MEIPYAYQFWDHIIYISVVEKNLQPLTLGTCATRDAHTACFTARRASGPPLSLSLSVHEQYHLMIIIRTIWASWCDVFYLRKPFSSLVCNKMQRRVDVLWAAC